MPTLLLLLIAGGIIYFFWNAARSAAERAVELGRNACRAADVQWLDQAVHATGLRLSRGEDGRLGFERTFKFEYSYDGIDRHVGRMVLRGDQLISFTGPGRRGSARSGRMWRMPRMCRGLGCRPTVGTHR